MKLFTALAVASSIPLLSALDELQKPLQDFQPKTVAQALDDGHLDLELKHIFHRGSTRYPDLHRRLDINRDSQLWATSDGESPVPRSPPRYRARPRKANIHRLSDRSPAAIAAALDMGATFEHNHWTIDEVEEPDVRDKETVLAFARMANDAYYLEPGTGEWVDVGHGFNYTEDFGWEDDGLRGHIFADVKNQTVVIAMKGTSLPFKDPRGTISNDKTNDNLLFGCCCGQGGRWWYQKVCDCQTEYQVGNSTCLRQEIREKTRYYHLGLELYHNVTKLYPDANIWLSGHSLGGSLASLIGLTVGQPAVTFEAPADATAALRLGLPTPPGFRLGNETQADVQSGTLTYHFGHTADDIFMGNCNAWNSVCTLGGYAMEVQCHTGSICIYDTVKDKGWGRNARSNHGIGLVIKDVIDSYNELAECKAQTDCRDCEQWQFF